MLLKMLYSLSIIDRCLVPQHDKTECKLQIEILKAIGNHFFSELRSIYSKLFTEQLLFNQQANNMSDHNV